VSVDQRISDNLVRLVQVVFGLVVAQSLLLYRSVIVAPGSPHYLAAVALLVIYATTVLSWIDWHRTMEFNPYNLNPRHPYKIQEQFRLGVDLVIVSIYAYALFTIAIFETDPRNSVARFLLAFPLIFLAYVVSGLLRRLTHGKHASNLRPILEFGLAFSLVWVLYVVLAVGHFSADDHAYRQWVNLGTLVAVLGLMLLYRLRRSNLRNEQDSRKAQGLRIGVDIDGVLANQIAGILPRIRARYGVDLSYDDITDWQLPIGTNSDVKVEIENAMSDPDYILRMPLHADAARFMETLFDGNRLYVVTARPLEAKADTEAWLGKCKFRFDGLINLKEKAKSMFQTDVLVDDYVGNVDEYLSNSSGIAVLVSQPWNQDHTFLTQWEGDPRLVYAVDLSAALTFIQDYSTFLRSIGTEFVSPPLSLND
jgi:5'(3')-deoxyribonucleotidase